MNDLQKLQAETAIGCRRFVAQFQHEAKARNETGKLGVSFRPPERRKNDYVVEFTYISQRTADDPVFHQWRLFASELNTMTDEKMRESAKNALDSFRQAELARGMGLV